MTLQDFQTLRYGAIFVDVSSGRKLIVVHTNRDDLDQCTAIGVAECFQASESERMQLLEATPHIAKLLDNATGKTIGIIKTAPEKEVNLKEG